MSSYLAEVLSSVQSVEKMEIEQISSKCSELGAQVQTCKGEVLSYLENVYVKFIERPKQNKALASKVKEIQCEVSGLADTFKKITMKELTKSESEIQQHLHSLHKIEMEISLVSILQTFHVALTEIRMLKESQAFLHCMQKIKETEEVINTLNLDDNLPVLREMVLDLRTEKNSILDILSNIVRDNVILKVEDDKTILKISKDTDILEEVLKALHFHNCSVTPLDNMTRFLWNHIFVPVVDLTTKIEVFSASFITLEVTVLDNKKKASYMNVFTNITTILQFLMVNFDISLGEDLSTLSYIGRDIRDNLSELIIKHCLQDTIPSTDEGLQKYKVVIEATEELEKTLIQSKIFADDTTSILKYANNIDVLFINKKCHDYLMMAQELMKKDLHDMIQVGSIQLPETSFEATVVGFPLCCISRNVIDLLNLLEKILTQASTTSDLCAGRLFCIVKTICKKYIIFVPEHHKKLLQTIPQQIALFYNNCMYISHKLCEWNNNYLDKLPTILNIGPNSLGDEGRQLREVASEKFTSYVDSQIKQIEEIMKDADLQKQTLEQLKPETEKCIRQCLRQQELLKTVWHKVLPYTVYNKTLGAILNSLCSYIVDAIIKLEDISSDAAEHLVELFKMIETRGPKLFTDPKEVSLFVSTWYKLDELAFVLNSSLLDINDRWADGKGPLALQFKAEEVKQLIRALFQNTERRAALLTKIHD